MKILFIDDCYRKDKKYFGYGGFCIDESDVRPIINDIALIKRKYKIPLSVELKWSPHPNHYLRTNFKGSRQILYKDAVSLLSKYQATVICAVDNLQECYGIKNHNWSIRQAILWATKQQFKFLSERFETPYLEQTKDTGLVIADHFSEKKGELAIVKESDLFMTFGTEFVNFEKICVVPMMTLSEYCPPVQLADLVTGIIVSSLANSKYGLDLFEDIALLFLKQPHKSTTIFASLYSSAILGYGLKLSPISFKTRGRELFEKIDNLYLYTSEGIKQRDNVSH